MKGNSKKWFDSVASERIKVSIATINSLKDNKAVKYGPKFISEAFQVFFTYMAKTLLQKLLLPRSKHGIDSISKFYKDLDMKPTALYIALKISKALKFPRQQVLIIFLEDF